MLELAFVVCMAGNPQSCEDRSLLFADVSLMQCVLGAQTVLAPWSLEHPGWVIDSYSCRQVEPGVVEI